MIENAEAASLAASAARPTVETISVGPTGSAFKSLEAFSFATQVSDLIGDSDTVDCMYDDYSKLIAYCLEYSQMTHHPCGGVSSIERL